MNPPNFSAYATGWYVIREVVLKKKVWERTQKQPFLKQLQTHFIAKLAKGVGMPFPRVPAPLHPCM